MSRRTYPVPNKNLSGGDYIQNRRAKELFSGTSNLAKTIEQQNGNFPLLTPLGKLKPYQGTYGLSGRSVDGNKNYCLNTSHSYRDLLAITKGKYLLTPPNIADDSTITFKDVSDAQKLYNGLYYIYTYNSNNLIAYMNPAYPTTPGSYVANQIQYGTISDANQRIIVDPSYVITYTSESCILHPKAGRNITINNDYDSRYSFNRTINLELLTGFQFPVKFELDYDVGDCINVNNDIQDKYAFPSSPTNIVPPFITASGTTLSCSTGTWTSFIDPILGYTYQWYRGVSPIPSAINSSYTIQSADAGRVITCKVTATNSAGSSTETSSNSINLVAPANITAPVITPPTIVAGSSTPLTCGTGTWGNYPPPTSYSYEWFKNGVSIGPATPTNTYYTQTPTDIHKTFTCKVTATNTYGTSAQVTSSNSVIVSGAPVNTTLPSISGNLLVGSQLLCDAGLWEAYPVINPSVGYAYQWLRNGSTPIGTNSKNYTTTSADIAQTITCQVTATNTIGSSAPATSSNSIVPTSAPVNTTAPLITGIAAVGSTMSCSTGTWAANPAITGYSYEWFRNGVSIAPATTTNTYTTQSTIDIGQTITCKVVATNTIGSSAPVTSSNSIIPTSAPVNTTAPLITGIAAVGSTLSCSTGTWAAYPVINPSGGYSYEWFRNGVSIAPATTTNTYTTQSTIDIGQTITCKVVATNTIGSSAPATSSNSIVPTSVPVLSTAPSITPTTIVAGSATPLTCSTGTWIANPAITGYAYQWFRNGSTPISGQTSNSYTTQSPGDIGSVITCQVTANNTIGPSSPATTSNSVVPSPF